MILHELFITHCTKGTSIMNPFIFIGDTLHFELYHFVGLVSDGHQQITKVGNLKGKVYTLNMHLDYKYLFVEKFVSDNMVHHWSLLILEPGE